MTTVGGAPFIVGSYAPADQPGVHVFVLDEHTSAIRHVSSVAGITNPSFLTIHPSNGLVFIASETGRADGVPGGSVFSYRIDRTAGSIDLRPVDRCSSEGDHPCHLRLDRSGHWLVVANYGSGTVAVVPISSTGAVGPPVSVVQHSGSGLRPDRQTGPHPHSSVFSPDNRFLIVADLGIDLLVVYAFDEATGSLQRHGEVDAAPGSGPRHLALHPSGDRIFVTNEFDATVTTYRWDGDAGVATRTASHPMAAETADVRLAADIHVSQTGAHVYASTRGDDTLAVFTVEGDHGLRRTAVRPTGGAWPRGFGISQSGEHIVVANRHSDELVVLPLFDRGADLGRPGGRATVTQPSCVVFL